MYLCIQYMLVRESRDQRLFVNYPKLFADFHALRRLLMPRHPPYTLSSLTTNIQPSLTNPTGQKPAKPAEGESQIRVNHKIIQINDNRFILRIFLTSQPRP